MMNTIYRVLTTLLFLLPLAVAPAFADVILPVDTAGDAGAGVQVVAGVNNFPVLSYAADDGLRLAFCVDRACAQPPLTRTLLNSGGLPSAVDVRADNVPVVAAVDGNAVQLVACADVTCDPAADGYVVRTVSGVGEVATYLALTISEGGNPLIAYYDANSDVLRSVACADSTCNPETPGYSTYILDDTANVGEFVRIATRPGGLPVMVYEDSTADTIKYIRCGDAACDPNHPDFLRQVVANSVGNDPWVSVAVGLDDRPVISYHNSTLGTLRLAVCADINCDPMAAGFSDVLVDNDGVAVGTQNSLRLSIADIPTIAYAVDGGLRLAECADATCDPLAEGFSITPIVAQNAVDPALLDFNGRPLVAYYHTLAGDLNIYAINTPPQLTVNEPVELSRGNTLTLTADDLFGTDPDNDLVIFTVETGPANGSIAPATQFTMTDIQSGSVQYTHSGDNTLIDAFTFSIGDGIETVGPFTFNITITPNELPVLVNNVPVEVASGEQVTLDSSVLQATDPDNSPLESLLFRVLTPPESGTLSLGDSFTQASIDAGELSYLHDGAGATMDSFMFDVTDGATVIGPFTFEITIGAALTGVTRIQPAADETLRTPLTAISWRAVEGIDWYALRISDVETAAIMAEGWVEATRICGTNGLCALIDDEPNLVFPRALPNGNYRLEFATYDTESDTASPYDAGTAFSIDSVPVFAPLLIAPAPRPVAPVRAVIWQHQLAASSYHLRVTDGNNRTIVDQWAYMTQVCQGTICEVDLPMLATGQYTVRLGAWGPSVPSLPFLTDATLPETVLTFTVEATPPAPITLTLPVNGDTVEPGVLPLQWPDDIHAQWYRVVIMNLGRGEVTAEWINGADICGGVTCTHEIQVNLGTVQMWVSAWGPGGAGTAGPTVTVNVVVDADAP